MQNFPKLRLIASIFVTFGFMVSISIYSLGCATQKAKDDTDQEVRYRPKSEQNLNDVSMPPQQPLVKAVQDDMERDMVTRGGAPGTLSRSEVLWIKRQGPASVLAMVELSPVKHKGRLIGHQVVKLSPKAQQVVQRFEDGPKVGDLIRGINGYALENPDDLMKIWETLDTAPGISFDLMRLDGDQLLPLQVVWPIE